MTRLFSNRWVRMVLLLAVVAILYGAPYMAIETGGVLPGAINRPASLFILATVLVIAALAVSYDLVLGYTGLFSFAHGMFFALGGYAYSMFLAFTNVGFGFAILFSVLICLVAAIAVNAVALRAEGIAFAMVTLAISQVFAIGVERNYFQSGGDEGVTVPFTKIPAALVGLFNTKNVYWVVLSVAIAVVAISALLVKTRLGRVWIAIRENELRMKVLGYNTYLYKLSVTVVASVLAGVCGVAYSIVLGAADPQTTKIPYILGLIVILILGGRGRIWGAIVGAVLYQLLVMRLPSLGTELRSAGLPDVIKIPLSEPRLILGVVFILFIFFARDGLAGLLTAFWGKIARARPEQPRDADPPRGLPEDATAEKSQKSAVQIDQLLPAATREAQTRPTSGKEAK